MTTIRRLPRTTDTLTDPDTGEAVAVAVYVAEGLGTDGHWHGVALAGPPEDPHSEHVWVLAERAVEAKMREQGVWPTEAEEGGQRGPCPSDERSGAVMAKRPTISGAMVVLGREPSRSPDGAPRVEAVLSSDPTDPEAVLVVVNLPAAQAARMTLDSRWVLTLGPAGPDD